MGTSRPLIGREAWGRGPPAHPVGGRFPKGLFANFLFAKRSLTGQAGASRPSKGRDVVLRGIPPFGRAGRPPRLYKPEPAPKILFYSEKIRRKKKRGEEERRGSGEALFTRRFGGIFLFYPYNYLKIIII
jgi:hypothetical protein